MAMTKKEALQYADGSVNKLAALFGITHSAVSMWDEDQIPELREYQLREMIEKKQILKQPETEDA